MSKTKYSHKVIAFFLALNILQSILPYNLLYASNNGPTAPEASGFESANATDMVNLVSGDMSYVLPIMDVGGLPISLSYHGGIPLDLESTWTGLGWNLNTGAINRSLNATPDDWKGGNSLDFIRYEETEEVYTVNAGVGISKTAEVGIGASWGSNKSLSGSVYGSIGIGKYAGASGSIDTDGNYSLGLSLGTGKEGNSSFGGGIGVSGNVNNSKKDYGAGVGYQSASGMSVGVGASLEGKGMSASLGYSGTNGQGSQRTGAGGSGSLSTASFSAGDWEVSSKGWYIPIQVYCFSFGFGKQKIKFSLAKGFKKSGFGILYSKNENTTVDAVENEVVDASFADYQNRYRYADAYDQALPVAEKEFVGDYDSEKEKLNFTYSAYDNYDVSATGISGMMQPRILQNSTVYGLGYSGSDPKNRLGTDTETGKMKIYWHNSLTTEKTMGTGTAYDTEFYFNGQFTQNTSINSLSLVNSNLTKLQNLLSARPAIDNNRLRQGNYVEVYTNSQLGATNTTGLLAPLDPKANGLTLTPLVRNASEYKPEGIGGYKITSPDGKVYHFSQPVYHYEMVERNVLKQYSPEDHVSEKRQYSPYATHWLLTAITGPDFIDVNNNKIADPADYGYWVRMDYGKWSDGYVWRNPTDSKMRDYTTNIQSEIAKRDFGTYQFGRKQLYYLDRVVSNTHTAYFIKDLRYDSVGSDLNYSFAAQNINNEGTGGGVFNPGENFTYARQMQLMLEKIVLVKNSDATISKGNNSSTSTNPLLLNTRQLPGYNKSYTLGFSPTGGFYNEYGQPTVVTNNESGVYDVADFNGFDYNKAIKVVDLEYNYNLAVRDHTNSITNPDANKSNGSPGVIYDAVKNPNNGKLCLKSVRFLGRNNFDYMPPYQFEYNGEFTNASSPYIKYPANALVKKGQLGSTGINWLGNPILATSTQNIPIANARAKDDWGFLKDAPGQQNMATAWSMTKITTPTGAKIEIENEEDDFYTEAFSRRYWTSGLEFEFNNLSPYIFGGNNSNRTIDLHIRKNQEESLLPNIDFRKYFLTSDPVFIDFFLCVADRDFGGNSDFEKIDIPSQGLIPISVNQGEVVFRLKLLNYVPELEDSGDLIGYTFSLGRNLGWADFDGEMRDCAPKEAGDGFVLKYKILSNKTPEEDTGGGLRVKSITLSDESGNKYKTSYYYNRPGTSKEKNSLGYISSGITSYSPVRGQKFVPYQSELPTPGVMYEYVTMEAQDINGNNLGSTRYRFYTLKPVLDIFNENIEMKDDDGTTIFKATVTPDGYLNPTKKVRGRSIKLDVNTSLVGQFRSIEEFNKVGQLLTKTERKYISGTALKALAALTPSDPNKINRGSLAESFQSMKSVYITDANWGGSQLVDRYLSVSTKEEYSSVLESIITTGIHGKTVEKYRNTDPQTGAFLTVETTKSNGIKQRVERIPAYRKYSAMGSKVDNYSNKNMLTQEAVVITAKEYSPDSGTWYSLSGELTTWNKTWLYTQPDGTQITQGADVWRKHKSYILSNGIATSSTNPYFANIDLAFDWNTGNPTNAFTWKKASEITRYNHFSNPLEVKDINNNFASTKMADNQTKAIVSGNARYSEMYYSGAEHIATGNWFDGEVQGALLVSKEAAHTGSASIKLKATTDKGFQINGTSGATNYYTSTTPYTATFRPGKYRVSVWALNQNAPERGTALMLNSTSYKPSETLVAGCWTQFVFYIDIPANTSNTIYLKNGSASATNPFYYDDFRMHPISSSINSYVYNAKDQLICILDGNNMGEAFVYDNADRLQATYTEVLNSEAYMGGFRITKQVKQKYKGSNDASTPSSGTLVNCPKSLNVNITNECAGTFENRFKITPEGGSGNYTYQYKWLTNSATSTYSNYTSGTNTVYIPYAAAFCNLTANPTAFNKKWDFTVKVTDVTTGFVTEKNYSSATTSCSFQNATKAEIEVSNCNANCAPSKYSFRVHLKDNSIAGNYKYEFAYFVDGVANSAQSYTNITSTSGKFCPVYNRVADSRCPSGSRDYVKVIGRITNLTTGEVSYTEVYNFMGDCTTQTTAPLKTISATLRGYLDSGSVIKTDSKGSILEVTNITKLLK